MCEKDKTEMKKGEGKKEEKQRETKTEGNRDRDKWIEILKSRNVSMYVYWIQESRWIRTLRTSFPSGMNLKVDSP